jgi:phosphoribosylaminoimidazole carboxylase (NCAIR synthetase)
MFGGGVDVVTFGFENIRRLPRKPRPPSLPVRPSGVALHVAQQRAREKSYLADRGFP